MSGLNQNFGTSNGFNYVASKELYAVALISGDLEQYQKPVAFGSKLKCFTRTISGSYTISCQEYKQIALRPKL